jgi:hypothetical protein
MLQQQLCETLLNNGSIMIKKRLSQKFETASFFAEST